MLKRAITIICALVLILTGCATAGEPTWEEQYNLGLRYLYEGNYEEAIIAFTAAIEIEPKRTEAYIGLADTYIGMEEPERAQGVLMEGIEITGEDIMREKLAELQYEMGEENLDRGKFEEAAENFRDSIENNPKREDAHLGLADALMEMGELEKAIEALQDAMDALDKPSDALKDWLDELEELKDALDTLMGFLSAGDLDALQGDDVKGFLDVLNKYMDMCYDGERLVRDYTGVGFKMLMESFIYYGDLVHGEPNGTGDGIYLAGPYDYYSGGWSGGKPNGEGTEITIGDDYTILDIGTYVDGKGNGSFSRTETYSDGTAVYQMTVENGEVTSGKNPVSNSASYIQYAARVFVYGFDD